MTQVKKASRDKRRPELGQSTKVPGWQGLVNKSQSDLNLCINRNMSAQAFVQAVQAYLLKFRIGLCRWTLNVKALTFELNVEQLTIWPLAHSGSNLGISQRFFFIGELVIRVYSSPALSKTPIFKLLQFTGFMDQVYFNWVTFWVFLGRDYNIVFKVRFIFYHMPVSPTLSMRDVFTVLTANRLGWSSNVERYWASL